MRLQPDKLEIAKLLAVVEDVSLNKLVGRAIMAYYECHYARAVVDEGLRKKALKLVEAPCPDEPGPTPKTKGAKPKKG